MVNQNSAAEEEGEVNIGELEPKLKNDPNRTQPEIIQNTEKLNKESSTVLKMQGSGGTL